jgi:hypothetical protein
MTTKRIALLAATILTALTLTAAPAYAGSGAHWGTQLAVSPDATGLTVAGDLAGLGSQPEIVIGLTATSDCGGPLSTTATFPVEQGRTSWWLAVADQPCAAAPTFTNIVVTEAVSGLSMAIPGVYQWTP